MGERECIERAKIVEAKGNGGVAETASGKKISFHNPDRRRLEVDDSGSLHFSGERFYPPTEELQVDQELFVGATEFLSMDRLLRATVWTTKAQHDEVAPYQNVFAKSARKLIDKTGGIRGI